MLCRVSDMVPEVNAGMLLYMCVCVRTRNGEWEDRSGVKIFLKYFQKSNNQNADHNYSI